MKGNLKATFAAVLLFGFATVAHADTYTLFNDSGGDGYVVGSYPTFHLFGSNNGSINILPNTTTYTTIVSAPETIDFHWNYITHDYRGSALDPAGYVLNGVYTQLSTDGFVQGAVDSSGITSIDLAAGDTFGWYVFTFDGYGGRGELDVSTVTPEPGTGFLLGTGLLALAAISLKKLA